MKSKVLIVGEHPYGPSGNSGMTRGILSQIDLAKFEVSCYAVNGYEIDFVPFAFSPPPFTLLQPKFSKDPWGKQQLLEILRVKFDILLFVGIDIWRYVDIFPQIKEIQRKSGFKWSAIFPYDLKDLRSDWISWVNCVDFPRVYSQYGERMLHNYVPNLKYFRPSIQFKEIWREYPEQIKKGIRRKLFPQVTDDELIFGFIGSNIFRKDIKNLIKGYSLAKSAPGCPKIRLYLHTFDNGACNIKQVASDCGIKTKEILMKNANQYFSLTNMPDLYNCFDCLVNCTMQEGLSWTPIEAMLCGVPIIASDSTAHPEIIQDVGMLVKCKTPASVPLLTSNGEAWIDAFSCAPEDTAKAIYAVARYKGTRKLMHDKGLIRGKLWAGEPSNVNDLFEEILTTKTEKIIPPQTKAIKKKAILFAQHSSAGDIFMTTRCFKGLKERHNLPLYYMTQKKFFDVIEGNPFIEKLIEWDESQLTNPEYIVYNPHGDRILPGHWGRNSNALLSDFYWKILDLEPDNFFIKKENPEDIIGIDLDELKTFRNLPICVVHTTGGDPQFRTYKYMGDVCKGLKGGYLTIQLGSKDDFPAGSDLDLRGKLSFNQTAWVMSKADIAVTVDSFISHLAGAFGVSQICLFGSGNHFVVKPNQLSGTLVCMVPDYIKDCKGLGPCSASVRDCPTPCTGVHDPKEILAQIERIEVFYGRRK